MSDVYPCLSMPNTDEGTLDSKFVKNNNRRKEVSYNEDSDETSDMSSEENQCAEDDEGIFVRELSKTNIYDQVHACAYCSKVLTNISKHMKQVHKNEPQVREIMEFSGSKK